MDLNLDVLAQETINLSHSYNGVFPRKFDGLPFEEIEKNLAEEQQVASVGPGLAFRIEQGEQTFCIRAVIVDQIEYLPADLEQGDRRLYQELRIENLGQLREIFTFETNTIELAEVIVDQMSNRRFPYREDNLCNISDPGFSWWLDSSANRLQIFFQSHGIDRSVRYQNIGPLGDSQIAAERLTKLFPLLEKLFEVNEYVADSKSFCISVGPTANQALFEKFKALFISGIEITDELSFLDKPEHKTLLLYLEELAILRQFWLSIEENLQ